MGYTKERFDSEIDFFDYYTVEESVGIPKGLDTREQNLAIKSKTDRGLKVISTDKFRYVKKRNGDCFFLDDEVFKMINSISNNYVVIDREWFDLFFNAISENLRASIHGIRALTLITNESAKLQGLSINFNPKIIKDMVSGRIKTRIFDKWGNDIVQEIREAIQLQKAKNKEIILNKLEDGGSTWARYQFIYNTISPPKNTGGSININNGVINSQRNIENQADDALDSIIPPDKYKIEEGSYEEITKQIEKIESSDFKRKEFVEIKREEIVETKKEKTEFEKLMEIPVNKDDLEDMLSEIEEDIF
jgi:hypothetical protein